MHPSKLQSDPQRRSNEMSSQCLAARSAKVMPSLMLEDSLDEDSLDESESELVDDWESKALGQLLVQAVALGPQRQNVS